MGSLGIRHDWVTSLWLFTFMHLRRKWQPTPVFLPGESQDGGAWWAAVYGVAQSRTGLKQLSSSSSRRGKGNMLILRRQHIQTQILELWLQPYWGPKLQLRVCPQWRQGSTVSILLCCCLVAKSYPTLVTPWTVAWQSPLSLRFTSHEYWSGSPSLSPGDLPDPGIELASSALANRFSLPLSHQSRPHFLCACSVAQSRLTLLRHGL